MPAASEELLPLLALFLLRNVPAPATPPAPRPLPSTTGTEIARTRTGGQPLPEWFGERFGLALENLVAAGVPDVMVRPVALSLLAQWAHETARGKSEFNFNLGGWRARKSDPFFVARDVMSGAELFRWTAYPDLPTAVADQIARLASRFPSAWKLLLAQPNSSAWVEELGRRGYYTANPQNYARAWAANRAELGVLAQ